MNQVKWPDPPHQNSFSPSSPRDPSRSLHLPTTYSFEPLILVAPIDFLRYDAKIEMFHVKHSAKLGARTSANCLQPQLRGAVGSFVTERKHQYGNQGFAGTGDWGSTNQESGYTFSLRESSVRNWSVRNDLVKHSSPNGGPFYRRKGLTVYVSRETLVDQNI